MKARPVFEDDIVFITRRVRGGQYRLLPKRQTNQIVKYLLAVLSERYEIDLYAVSVMSNHWHSVAHDLAARYPEFAHDFHQFLTQALNATYSDTGSMWNSKQTNVVRPELPTDVLDKIGYTVANPVRAGLCRSVDEWPGVSMAWPDRPETVRRPACRFFNPRRKRANGEPHWPDHATLRMHRPRGFEQLPDNELAILIRDQIADQERQARAKLKAENRKFMSRRRVLAQSRYDAPNKAPEGGDIVPTVACKDRELRIERLRANKGWYLQYVESRRRWRAGEREVVFPYGTYLLVRQHSVNVEEPISQPSGPGS